MNSMPHDEDVKGISALIRERAHELDVTYRELEARSERAGNKVKYQTFAQLVNPGPKSWPKESATIKGISSAIEVSEEAVVLAFATTFGLEISGRSKFASALPAGIDRLDPAVRDSFLRLIRDVLRNEGGGGHASSTADTQAAGSAAPGTIPDTTQDDYRLAAREGTPDQLPDTDFDSWGA